MKFKFIVPVLIVLGIAGAAFASANTLSITPASSKVGSGTTSVAAACGTVSSVTYVLAAGDAAVLDKVTFATAAAAACAAANGTDTVYAGTTPIDTQTCTVTADVCETTSFVGVNVADVTNTAITLIGP